MAFGSNALQSVPHEQTMEQVLVLYYARLHLWARTIARQDEGLAEDIVQDVCVALCLSPPDLSLIGNLEGYLYTALRHVYLARVQRIRRERVTHLSIDEYDSVQEALSVHLVDPLDAQNDLLRLCTYLAWRRRWSKSASQFLLHFFHGYHRQDVAKLSRVPTQAVYNSLADLRTEVREHLGGRTKARLLRRPPPQITQLRAAEEPEVFLRRVRAIVLKPRESGHLKAAFFASYAAPAAKPLAVNELAHLSGCELCLRVLEEALSIDDHDGPMDLPGSSSPSASAEANVSRRIQLVRSKRLRLLHRRPAALSLLVNGKEEATIPTETFRNFMPRIRRSPRDVEWVQIVDEAGNCLLYQQCGPDSDFNGASVTRLALSDDRTLDLTMYVRGAFLEIDSSYSDPALEEARSPLRTRLKPANASSPGWSTSSVWRMGLAGALLVSVIGITWYARRTTVALHDSELTSIVSRAIAAEPKPDASTAIHQVVTISDASDPAHPVTVGFVDSWADILHGKVWSFYGAQQQKLAEAAQALNREAPTVSHSPGTVANPLEQAVLSSGIWLDAFTDRELKGGQELRTSELPSGGYALDSDGGERKGVEHRRVVLDANYQAKEETVRLETRKGLRSVRLVRTTLSRVAAKSFPTQDEEPQRRYGLSSDPAIPVTSATTTVEIAALFDLFQAKLDVGQSIEVRKSANGQVIVEGVVSDAVALMEARKSLAMIPQQALLDDRLQSFGAGRQKISGTRYGTVEMLGSDSSPGPGVEAVQDLFRSRGLAGAALDKAAHEHMNQAVEHADLLLQHAAALQRLGQVFNDASGTNVDLRARQQWATMVEAHSRAESLETATLQQLLQPLSKERYVPWVNTVEIRNASAFRRTSSELLRKAQQVHAATLLFFSESGFRMSEHAISASQLLSMLPVMQERQVAFFAATMTDAAGKTKLAESRTSHP